jgi:DNA helicase-2/ATP-dependent DNA helicase PcrA
MTEEENEKQYLKNLLGKIAESLSDINETIESKKEEIDYMNKHMQEHKRDMDHLEKNSLREAILNYTLEGEHSVENKRRLFRLRDTAYFGRIDFTNARKDSSQPIYVGVHNFQDRENNQNLVYDWRAPISGLFYDFELGEASYESNAGRVEGNISLKRQFRIRKGELEYMLDTDVTIHDDVLQRELNQASSTRMRNIVATIQREQNAIIRNEEARHLIIQGVAGSGKTSIALHRIAFLLYRFKETISSEDILIISPNKVFANYISNVLPELGEDTVAETSMEEIANDLFEYQVKFQSFFEQVAELLEKGNDGLIERIRFKSSQELLRKMNEYLLYLENTAFKPADIFVAKKPVPAWFIQECFQKYSRLPILSRFNEVVRAVVQNVFIHYKIEVQGSERTRLHATIRKMFPSTNLRMLYKGFYEWMGRPQFLKIRGGGVYEYSDVFPLLYLKMKLEGLKPNHKVKHLVIDEMQDYSAVQYHVISSLFSCKKTILGDINQSVNPFSSSSVDTIKSVFADATTMRMLKSYRSTYEITEFSKRIGGKGEVEAIHRHGEGVNLLACKNRIEEIDRISALIEIFQKSEFNSLGIICKTQRDADELYDRLKDAYKISLLHAASVSFGKGIVVTTAHLAKGLEFDEVVVPTATMANFRTEMDRCMLYIACTRAMHKLTLTYVKEKSHFIED